MSTKKNKKVKKNKLGRPLVIDKSVLAKLEQAFSLGATDREACIYADIDPATLYRHQEKHPEFCERKELLKEKPILLARQELINGLRGNPELAFKFLERKQRKEFGVKQEIEHSGKIEASISVKEELLMKLSHEIPGDNKTTAS